MIFNLKLIDLQMSKDDQRKAEEGLSVISSYAKLIMDEYETFGTVIGNIQSPILTIVPKQASHLVAGNNLKKYIDYMMEETENNKKLRNFIGLLNNGEYNLQENNYPKKQWMASGLFYAFGIIASSETGIVSLNKLNGNFHEYDFFVRAIGFEGQFVHIDNRCSQGNIIFGALNPYHHYLFPLFEKTELGNSVMIQETEAVKIPKRRWFFW